MCKTQRSLQLDLAKAEIGKIIHALGALGCHRCSSLCVTGSIGALRHAGRTGTTAACGAAIAGTAIPGAAAASAAEAAIAVAANPGGAYNPLFIHGNSGLGKTHLLNAICHEIKRNDPSMKIVLTDGEEFTNEFIEALNHRTTTEFQNKYRKVDVLLMDDVQFIASKERTQEEFFHTFNTLYEANKQILLNSDRPPKEIKTLEDRLRSRF